MLNRAFDLAVKSLRADSRQPTILEFGVASGNTYVWLAQAAQKVDPRIHLIGFDSFQGLPDESSEVWRPDRHAKGQFKFGPQVVADKLRMKKLSDPKYSFVHGFYENTLKAPAVLQIRDQIDQLLLVNIDVDLHVSTIQLLEYIKPLLGVGTVLYFDDWKDPQDGDGDGNPWGEHRAWAEWTEGNPDISWAEIEVGPLNNRFTQITGVPNDPSPAPVRQ